MQIKTEHGQYYEVIARISRTDERGETKRVKDIAVVDAASFADAEEQGFRCYDGCDAEIANINPATYADVLEDAENTADRRYYKAKVDLIDISDNGKETRTKVVYLVYASSVKNAEVIVNEYMGVGNDYHVGAVAETKISEVWHG